MLALSACGAQAPALPTPTINVTAVYTSAFQTITAQEATARALTPPVPTATAAALVAIPQTGGGTSAVANTGGGTSSAGTTQGCDNATYVSDVTIPDRTIMTPGQPFVKTWAVTNSGACAWTSGY